MTEEDDKRRYERYPVSRPVETSMATGTRSGALVDISAGGAAIVASGPLAIAIGEPVELRVENFEKLSGHIVRADGGTGFAIAFDAGAEATGATIRGILGAVDGQ